MYNEDIRELLEHCKAEVLPLVDEAKKGSVNKVKLKNLLENFRSILDYHSKDLLEALKKTPSEKKLPEKVYFPYGVKENHFKKSIARNLPSLGDVLPEAYFLIESVQPFKSGDSWIVDLCTLTNEAKHNNLSKTNNHKSVSINQENAITVKGAVNVRMTNNYVNGRRMDDVYVNENGNTKVVRYSGTTIVTESNKIVFSGKKLEIAPFIIKCCENIERLSIDLSGTLK